MRNISTLFVVAVLFLVPLTVTGDPVKAKHAIELDDATGDVLNDGEEPGKDVVKLGISSDGKELLFTVLLDKNVAEYLAGNKAGDVVQVNVDADNDAGTGGKTFWGGKEGFEYVVGVRTCIKYEKGEACAGGLNSVEEGYFSSYGIEKFVQGKTDTKNTHDIFWESPRVDIKGNEVTVPVPYADIAVSSGDTIRLVVREADSSYDEKSFFPDILLTLK